MTTTENLKLKTEAKIHLTEGMREEFFNAIVYRDRPAKEIEAEFEVRCALIGVNISSVKCGRQEFERRKHENCL